MADEPPATPSPPKPAAASLDSARAEAPRTPGPAMELGMIGLGRMGGNLATRLVRGGHRVVAHSRTRERVDAARSHGAEPAYTMEALVAALAPPRIVWVMVPAGDATEKVLDDLLPRLTKGDLVVDGGNSYYKDTVRRAARANERGLRFVDVGTSGGVWGLEGGYSLMAGGAPEDVEEIRPLLETLAPAPNEGWGRVGPAGAGHFVKMVHNGIEYGLMAAFAEGFGILRAKSEYELDLAEVARIWRRGSVVRSWLLDLSEAVLRDPASLERIAPFVPDSGEGRWTLLESLELGVPAPVLALALEQRIRSQVEDPFEERLLAALRQRFGGHAVRTR